MCPSRAREIHLLFSIYDFLFFQMPLRAGKIENGKHKMENYL
jgi:hypothetical protein